MSWKDEFKTMIKSGMSQADLISKLSTVKIMGWVNDEEHKEILALINESFE